MKRKSSALVPYAVASSYQLANPVTGGALTPEGIALQVLAGVLGEATGVNPNPGGKLVINAGKAIAKGALQYGGWYDPQGNLINPYTGYAKQLALKKQAEEAQKGIELPIGQEVKPVAYKSAPYRYAPMKRGLLGDAPRGLLGDFPAKRFRPGYDTQRGYYGRYNGQPGRELKFFDTALSFNVDNTGEVPATGQLVLIPQGTTESTRIAGKCVIRSIQIRANALFDPAASATAATTIALWVVLDTQCNGAAAAITDVFTSNDIRGSMINIANSRRFRILRKFIFSMNSPAGVTTAYNRVERQIEFYKKCYIMLDFSSTTGAITELKSNNIFLLAGAANSDDQVSITGTCRVRFQG